MKREFAEHVVATASARADAISRSVRMMRESVGEDDFLEYRRLAGRLSGSIFGDLVQPLFAYFPDLEQQVFPAGGATGSPRPVVASDSGENITALTASVDSWIAEIRTLESGLAGSDAAEYGRRLDTVRDENRELGKFVDRLHKRKSSP